MVLTHPPPKSWLAFFSMLVTPLFDAVQKHVAMNVWGGGGGDEAFGFGSFEDIEQQFTVKKTKDDLSFNTNGEGIQNIELMYSLKLKVRATVNPPVEIYRSRKYMEKSSRMSPSLDIDKRL